MHALCLLPCMQIAASSPALGDPMAKKGKQMNYRVLTESMCSHFLEEAVLLFRMAFKKQSRAESFVCGQAQQNGTELFLSRQKSAGGAAALISRGPLHNKINRMPVYNKREHN